MDQIHVLIVEEISHNLYARTISMVYLDILPPPSSCLQIQIKLWEDILFLQIQIKLWEDISILVYQFSMAYFPKDKTLWLYQLRKTWMVMLKPEMVNICY